MLHHGKGGSEFGRQRPEYVIECWDSAGRCPDDYHSESCLRAHNRGRRRGFDVIAHREPSDSMGRSVASTCCMTWQCIAPYVGSYSITTHGSSHTARGGSHVDAQASPEGLLILKSWEDQAGWLSATADAGAQSGPSVTGPTFRASITPGHTHKVHACRTASDPPKEIAR